MASLAPSTAGSAPITTTTTTVARRKAITRAAEIPPLYGILPLVLVLALWQLLGPEQSVYAPRPSQWAAAVAELWRHGELQAAAMETLVTFVIAFATASVLGTAIGILIGRSRLFDRMLGPVLEFFRVMPAAAIVPLAVLIAGYTEEMKVGVVVFSAIWPILLQVRTGARTIDPILMETGRALHLSFGARLFKMLIPAMYPSILQGMRLAVSPILIIVLLVEILTRINGLGGVIEHAQQNYDTAAVYGLLVVTGALALAVNTLVTLAEGALLRHRPH
jgi:ABC-type nitrate/sulfonate/bicarbonate transport system permease component